MSAVLITGGAGFIGYHLARSLAADGISVDLVDDLSRGNRDPSLEGLTSQSTVRLFERDLRQPDALSDLGEEYSCIFHLAAIVGVANVVARPLAVLCENVVSLSSALDLATRQRALSRFVFASTSEVYAASVARGQAPVPTPEDVDIAIPPLDAPRTSYMLSKLYGEAMCAQTDLQVTVVRPHNVYGPRMGMAHVVPELLRRIDGLTDGDTLTVDSFDHSRGFCYVDDAVSQIRALCECAAAAGGTFNVGSEDDMISIGDLAGLLCEVVGKKLSVVPGAQTAGSPPRRRPDMSQTTATTGLRAIVPLREGIARTHRWYRENVFSGRMMGAC